MEPPDGRWMTSTEASAAERTLQLPGRVEPGDLLARRFRIVRILARGGMGLVLEAMDEELRTPVALKLILPELAASPEAVERLRREVALARRITHPNVCRVFEFFAALEARERRVFFTMELLSGETLSERIRSRGVIPLPEALDYARQMAEALDAAHSQSVVHRDFKSSNVLLVPAADRGFRVVVADFGIARGLDSPHVDQGLTATHSFLGTPAYMAPEQVLGEAAITPTTDTYAFGVVLYEMVTGTLPFQAETPLATAMLRLTCPPPRASEKAPGLPAVWDQVIARCLSRAPVDRFARPKDAVLSLTGVQRAARVSAGALPVESSSFVGRQEELARLGELLGGAGPRLLTLTGPGGVGKTRLAIEVARRLGGEFEGGVFFVNLAPLTEPANVPQAIAGAVGLKPNRDDALVEQIASAIRGQVLFVLDNFEHLAEAARVVGDLLRAMPEAKALVTSRTLLRLAGEHDFPLSGLALRTAEQATGQPARSDAIRLFAERARALFPRFALGEGNARDIQTICERLDGLPLAIELAASRIRVLEPRALVERLQSAGGTLRTLTAGARDTEARQRTLRSTIAWSDQLLSPAERRLFHRLGVFARACTLEAASAVDDPNAHPDPDVLEKISSLVDSSLLVRIEQEGAESRFAMLQTLREFALESLPASELAETRARHARHFLDVAERRAPELTGPAQLRHFDELEADHDELLAALEWFRETGASSETLRLAVALGHFWEVRGHWLEGFRVLKAALDAAPAAPPLLLSQGLHWRGVLAWNLGELQHARECQEETLRLARGFGDPERLMDALLALYWTVMYQGDLQRGSELNDEALQLAARVGDRRLNALAVVNRAWLACERGNLDEGERLNEEAIGELRAYRDQSTLLRHINCRGEIASMRGEWRTAEAACTEALGLARVTKYRRMISVASNSLAAIKIQLGEPEAALELLRESVAAARELGDPKREPLQLLTLAQIHARRGDLRRSVLLLAGARALLQSQGITLTMADKDIAREVETALRVLPAEERDRLEREGSVRSSRDLIQIGFEIPAS
jgi:non-specific serine/threonine protein kinase